MRHNKFECEHEPIPIIVVPGLKYIGGGGRIQMLNELKHKSLCGLLVGPEATVNVNGCAFFEITHFVPEFSS